MKALGNVLHGILLTWSFLAQPCLSRFFTDVEEERSFTKVEIAVRAVLALIMGTWLAMLPGYLAVIYMQKNGFFSYDFLVDALYAQSIFIVAAAFIFVGGAFVLYGFVVFLKIGLVERRDTGRVGWDIRIIFYGLLLVFFLSHWFLIEVAFSSNQPLSIMPPIVICVLVAFVFSSYVGKPFLNSFGDWRRPFIFLVLSIFVPLSQADYTASFVGLGLSMFKVGGGRQVTIFSKTSENEKIVKGSLLLLGPNVAYIQNEQGATLVVPINDNTVVAVDG